MTEAGSAAQATRRSSAWLALGVLAWVCAWALAGATVRAQGGGTVPPRRIGVHWDGMVPELSFSARDLADRDVRKKLQSGLPQVISVRVYAFRDGGRTVAASLQTCRVVYDLWEEIYRVQVQSAEQDRSVMVPSMKEVLDKCLVTRRLPIGHADNWANRKDEDVYFAVLVEFNPLSQDTVERIRRWLARPAGGGNLEGDAFFGSFVSLFVNRRIGEAERTLRFRSQPVTVP